MQRAGAVYNEFRPRIGPRADIFISKPPQNAVQFVQGSLENLWKTCRKELFPTLWNNNFFQEKRISVKNLTINGHSERKCRSLAEPPEAQRRRQKNFGRVLARRRASSREFSAIFYIILCPLKWCFYRTHVWHIYMYIIATWWKVKMTSTSSKKNPHLILYVLIRINMKSWLQHP